MQFGIQHGIGDPDWKPEILEPRAVIQFAQGVERAGFSHLAFTDHPSPSASWVNSGGEGVAELFTSLGFCAAVTSSIRLLTWVLVLPYHNPLAMAHRIATLDALSGGRVTLGVGTGYLKSEFFAQGAGFEHRTEVFDRHMEVMKQALAGADVTAHSQTYSARGIRVVPSVIQAPMPPVWIHGNSDFGMRRAARWGQAWVGLFTTSQLVSTIRTTPLPDIHSLKLQLGKLDGLLAEAGRTRDNIEIVVAGVVPMIDVREGWNREQYQQQFGELEALGVDRVVITVLGDDASASLESARQFAADFIG